MCLCFSAVENILPACHPNICTSTATYWTNSRTTINPIMLCLTRDPKATDATLTVVSYRERTCCADPSLNKKLRNRGIGVQGWV